MSWPDESESSEEPAAFEDHVQLPLSSKASMTFAGRFCSSVHSPQSQARGVVPLDAMSPF